MQRLESEAFYKPTRAFLAGGLEGAALSSYRRRLAWLVAHGLLERTGGGGLTVTPAGAAYLGRLPDADDRRTTRDLRGVA